MPCLHLSIEFLKNGDVGDSFFRHHSTYMLYHYAIDRSPRQVEIVGGQSLDDRNFAQPCETHEE